MKKVLATPGKFVLGSGVLNELAEYAKPYGNKLLLVTIPEDAQRVEKQMDFVRAAGVEVEQADFQGESSLAEIERICAKYGQSGHCLVLGLGGGKSIDTAKSVCARLKLPLIVVPTIASTDAPCSGMTILYDENHVMVGAEMMPKSPDIVLVDSAIIANAPPRFLVAGFGDALATYYEARACVRTNAANYVGGYATNAAYEMAKLCRKILLRYSVSALKACESKLVTTALENVIEANLYLSCIGFESVGCAGAHALHNAITILPQTHVATHGEKVAIGLLVQLVLENAPKKEMKEILSYYRAVGLPTSLAEIGLENVSKDELRRVAKSAIDRRGAIFNQAFEVSEDAIVDAFCMVDKLKEIV